MSYVPVATSRLSTNNVTESTLGGDAVYTGTMENVSAYNSILVNIKSDVVSAGSGVSIEYGPNASTQDIKISDEYMVSNGNWSKTFDVLGPFFRIVYTNGSGAQSSFDVKCTLNLTKQQNQVVSFPDESYDAFARLRVSNPYTLFQVSHNSDKQHHYVCEKLTTNGTSTHNTDDSSVDLVVTADSGSQVIRQSRMYVTYQPGKSLLFMGTGVLNSNSNDTACVTRIGLFDDQNGVYFKHVNGVLSVVLRSYVTGSMVETTYNSSAWNRDKMDGTGKSGISLDATLAQIFLIDLEWLGVGRVRCGVVVGGKIHYVHQIINANSRSTTYMTRASLPSRYQIDGGTSGVGTLKMICSTVISEGGYDVLGMPFSAGLHDGEGISLASGDPAKIQPLISIRLKSGFNHVLCKLYGTNILITTGGNIVYLLYHFLSPASVPLSDGSWISSNDESAIEYNISTAVTTLTTTNGMIMHQGYVSNNADYDLSSYDRTVNITSDIDGTSDIIVFAAQNLGGSAETAFASLKWSEYHT
jgi:hypothetical protein